jgi:hypothetical protein
MQGLNISVALACLAMAATTVVAEDTTDYRSPADMTVEERAAMMQGVNDYNGCVYKQGVAEVDKFPDVRQAADAAMMTCEKELDKLRELITGNHFEPGFAEQFVNHAKSRAARMLLPELAIRKGG